MATQDEIKAWFAANPGASDAQIAQAMKQNGVGTMQVSQATGISDDDVTRRYNAAMGLPEWTNRNLPAGAVRTYAPQYTTLSANSNPADVAGAYRQWSGANGGDTQANRDTAQGYLSNLGMGNGAINEAYNQYKSGGGGQIPAGGQGAGGQGAGGQGAGGQGQNLGMGMNPYLRSMGLDIGNQLADVWNRQILPGTRSSAIAAGGFGGSRQGVVESNALNDLGRNYISGMTNLYGNDYTGQQNRNLQRYGMDQGYDLGLGGLALQNKGLNNSYDLGLRNNDLGFSNLDANINQNNFNNNLASANFGLGVQNYLQNNNQAGITAGTNMQNTAAEYQKYLNSAGNAAGNAGGTRIGTTVS